MAPTAKLFMKLIFGKSINTNSDLALKSNTYINPAQMDITNLINCRNFAFYNNSKKTILLLSISILKKI